MSARTAVRFAARLVLTAASLLSLGACQGRPNELRYKVAPGEAYARLLRADIVGFRDARQCGMLIYFSTRETAPGAVTWDVTSSDVLVARFTLRVVPGGDGSVVAIELPKGPNGAEIYDGNQRYAHPALMQPMRPALRELVDSAMAARPYDWRRIQGTLNTDGLCSSLRDNFEASGRPYDLNDPSGMTHDDAEAARSNHVELQVEQDQVFADQS
jgi:hypothetical protein